MAELAANPGRTNVAMLGIGAARPKRLVSNAEVCEILDSSDEWIFERSGTEIVVKRGARPTLVRSVDAVLHEVPAEPVPQVVDTTAAGDSSPPVSDNTAARSAGTCCTSDDYCTSTHHRERSYFRISSRRVSKFLDVRRHGAGVPEGPRHLEGQ